MSLKELTEQQVREWSLEQKDKWWLTLASKQVGPLGLESHPLFFHSRPFAFFPKLELAKK